MFQAMRNLALAQESDATQGESVHLETSSPSVGAGHTLNIPRLIRILFIVLAACILISVIAIIVPNCH